MFFINNYYLFLFPCKINFNLLVGITTSLQIKLYNKNGMKNTFFMFFGCPIEYLGNLISGSVSLDVVATEVMALLLLSLLTLDSESSCITHVFLLLFAKVDLLPTLLVENCNLGISECFSQASETKNGI